MWELNCQAFFPDLILDLYKCQHSSSLVSSIKKRIFVIFERVPLLTPGFEPGTFPTEGECLIHYSIEEVMKLIVQKDNIYTQRSLRDRPRAQGHILSRLAFLKYLNYWKIAGLRPVEARAIKLG